MEMLKRRAIIVLGMHRSGTSVLARAVHLQGAVLPKTLMPSQADNPDGFWEPLPIVRFNNELLRQTGGAWDDPRAIDPAWWRNQSWRAHRVGQARQLLESEYPEGEVIVLKDPRISRLMPIWLDALAAAGLDPGVFLCCRNPLEVTSSLGKRNGMDPQRAHLLWLAYMLEAEAATRNLPRAIIPFEHVLTDWRKTLAKAYDAIKLDSLALDGEPADALDCLFSEKKRHYQATTEQLLQDEYASPLLKQAWTAFMTRPLPTAAVFNAVGTRLAVVQATMKPMDKPSDVPLAADNQANAAMGKSVGLVPPKPCRHLILHYHLFKNAGTSLDHILKQNFKEGWHEKEGPGPGWCAEDIAEYLRQHPGIVAFSSHTALLPPPMSPDMQVYPILFVRHPADRIRSIYEFELTQIAETDGARMAKRTDMAGYIKWRLNRKGDRAIRNFQAYRLAFAVPSMQDGVKLTEAERALKAVEVLPFVGVVERFDESLAKLQAWLKPVFPGIDFRPTRVNVTQQPRSSLEERLVELNRTIGDALYTELLTTNELDLQLYEKALAVLGRSA